MNVKKQKGYYAPDMTGIALVLLVCALFGLWKLIEVVWWLFTHISFS